MLRIGLIGLGKMGLSHLAIARSHPLVTSVAVCDPATYILDVLSKYTGAKTYSAYKNLFSNEELDAVIVATPSRYHGEVVRAALERGVHVFCEKPFCLDLADAEELERLATSKGLVNRVGYHYRFVAAFREAKRQIAAGAIGRIHHIRAEAYGPVVLQPKGSTWRTNKSEGGGCLYDYASHAIDLMNFFVGPPTRVSGAAVNKIFSKDVDDEVYANFEYDGGLTGQLSANWSDDSFRKMSMKISIWGTGGRITVDRQEVQTYCRSGDVQALGLEKGWNVRYTTDITEEVSYYLRGEEYSAQIDDFLVSVGSKTTGATSSFRTALQTDTVIDLILRRVAGESEAGPAVTKSPKRALFSRFKREP